MSFQKDIAGKKIVPNLVVMKSMWIDQVQLCVFQFNIISQYILHETLHISKYS